MNKKNWIIYNKKIDVENTSKLGLNPITARILKNRNIDFNEIKYILSNDLNDLNNECLLPDIDKTVEFVLNCIKNKKNIMVIGDYDIDGVCSTYILVKSIKNLGGIVQYKIPHRVKDGYGINKNIIDDCVEKKIDLIITCDNGISADEEISYAKKNNIDVIVTDHHEVLNLPKDAYSVINPKINTSKYPFREICGATVCLKFVKRLYELNGLKFDYTGFLEFVTIATIGDVMPIINENHIIVKLGLLAIKNTKNIGLKKLIEVAKLNDKNITVYHIGFIIGPMINASGRLLTAEYALELFFEENINKATDLSLKLKLLNEERKYETELAEKIGIEIATKEFPDDKILVINIPSIKESIAGIVAGKIKEHFNKPVIVLTNSNEENVLKASCRSIEEYDIFNELSKFKNYFIKFGGHKMAAGFSMDKKYLYKLRKFLNDECNLTQDDFIKKTYIDCEVPIKYINIDMIKNIEKIEPFGNGIERPIFAAKKVNFKILNVYGDKKNVIKLLISQENINIKAVLFMDYDEFNNLIKDREYIDILYFPTINEYNGYVNIELNIKDFR